MTLPLSGFLSGGGGGSGSGGDVTGPSGASSTDNALVRWDGATGRIIQDGVLTSADFNGDLTGPTTNTATSGFGTAFTNQPTNDSVTIVSDNAADTTQTVTIIGNTNGGDVVTTETVALNGIVGVVTVKVNWGQIVAVKLSAACAGTVTIQKTTGPATITTIAPAATSAGVFSTSTSAFNRVVSLSSNGATTKHAGIQGVNSVGATFYEGATLSGTTLVALATSFVTITELYIGDLENNRSLIATTTGGTKLNTKYVITGPTTAVTDNAIPRFDGTRSDLLQNSAVTVADTTGTLDNSAGVGKYISGGTNGAVYFSMGGVGAGNYGLGLDGSGVPSIINGNASAVGNLRIAGLLVPSVTTIYFGAAITDYPRLGFYDGRIFLLGSASTPYALTAAVKVIPSTAGSGAPNAVDAVYSGALYTNEGSTAVNYESLPTAAAGYRFTFIVQDADGMRVTAAAADTIRVIDKVTAAAGYLESTTIGSTLTLVSVNATEWYATGIHGVWTDGTFTFDDTGLTAP